MTLQDKIGILKSNYGRSAGWVIELDGKPVAELTDFQETEMFWCSYKITQLDPSFDLNTLRSDVHWDAPQEVFRSKAYPAYSCQDMICRYFEDDADRLHTRSLYVPVELSWLEKLLLALRGIRHAFL